MIVKNSYAPEFVAGTDFYPPRVHRNLNKLYMDSPYSYEVSPMNVYDEITSFS